MITGILRYFFVAAILFSSEYLQAQVLKFDHGTIEFYSGTVVSDIEAISKKADVSLNLNTSEVSVTVDIETFEFEYDLMQEHFNEKYMESEKFPQSKFTGKILQDISNGIEDEMEVDVSGKLTMHGVTKDIKFKARLSKQGEYILVETKIPVVFKNYDIDDPTILSKSVAKDVEIKSTFYLKQALI
jgi:polyisoprenoid-binding protein YceI